MKFKNTLKLAAGDSVAILSPSFAAPGMWPWVHELGLRRLKEIFELQPVEFPTTRDLTASTEEKAHDLIAAFQRPDIKGIVTTLGGDDQITYVKHLPVAPFTQCPKPFFGISDNTHIINHLWLQGIPSYYGGTLFTEFAMQGEMDPFTVKYLRLALFESKMVTLDASPEFNDIGLSWSDESLLGQRRRYQPNEGWNWDGSGICNGTTWGGCVESLDEMLRHGAKIPTLHDFSEIILFLETSDEIPSHAYVNRFLRALGERGILERVLGVLVGRPKAWEFGSEKTDDEKEDYKLGQRECVIRAVRKYNSAIPIVQNLDFGHTAPQICLPVGKEMEIDTQRQTIKVQF